MGPRYVVSASTVGWLVADGTATTRVRVWDEADAADEAFSSGTYTLIRASDGTTIVDADPIAAGSGLVERSQTLSSQTPGRYREHWTFVITADGSTIEHVREVGVSAIPVGPTATTSKMLQRESRLDEVYADGQTSWADKIAAAWDDLSVMALRHQKGEHLWSTLNLQQPHLFLSLTYVFRDLSTFTGDDYELKADKYEAAAMKWLDESPLNLDTDADGDVDSTHLGALPSDGPPIWRRRG